MSRNLSVCHDGFLDLGYDGVSFPYVIESSSGRLSGVFIDFFVDAARLLGCERGPRYVKFPTNATICENGSCYNDFNPDTGEVFTAASSTFLNPSSVQLFAYTAPISMNLKRVPAIALNTRIIFYTVFAYDALLAIFLALSIITLHPSFIKRFNLPGATFILFGLTLLGFIYQAKYNGNNTAIRKDAKTIQTSLSLVVSGQERFVFPDANMFNIEEVSSMIKNRGHTAIDDDHDRLRDVCDHAPRSTLSAFYEAEVLLFSQMDDLNRWCHLSSIPFGSRSSNLPAWLNASMLTGDNYSFTMSRRTPRRAVETLNFLILSVYNYDQQSSLLLRKFVSKLPLAQRILNGEADYTVDKSPFSMMQLELPLFFLALGLTASWAAFLIEWLCLLYCKKLLAQPKVLPSV